MKKKKVYLTLQNGVSFQGYAFGAEGEITGELVFSTGMVGYVETLTDPSNYGKIVVQTFPLIGNYGVMRADMESKKAWVSAYVVREYCEEPSNFRTEEKLDAFLKEEGVVGVYGIDTRNLTKILREEGEMNARISNKPLNAEEIAMLSTYKTEDPASAVMTSSQTWGEKTSRYTLAFWNFGGKKSTINRFVSQDCYVIDVPSTTTAEELLALNVDGVVISDGPGDPVTYTDSIEELKKLLGKKPVFGIGLGHQLTALAFGAKTKKQKYGHRGSNQPVKSAIDGRVYISTQNHGYTVIPETIKEGVISFTSVNDGSCEGIDYQSYKAFTVQFAPESCDNGNVENPLYKKFFAMIEKEKENA